MKTIGAFRMVCAGLAFSAAMVQAQLQGFVWGPAIVQGNWNLVAGSSRLVSWTAPRVTYSLAVIRIDDATGAFDGSWGEGGVTRIPIWGEYEFAQGIAVQPDGKVLVLGIAPDPAQFEPGLHPAFRDHVYSAVYRLGVDGSIDRSFNRSGRLIFHVGAAVPGVEDLWSSSPNGIEVDAAGRVVLFRTERGSRSDVARLNPDGRIDASFPAIAQLQAREVEFVAMIEFVNARDQYFLASDPAEFLLLDLGMSPGWERTGYAFHAIPSGSPRGVSVCRFLGKPEFGLGTHFYTADPRECDDLGAANDHAWMLETREAFRVETPDPVNGACGGNATPIYRLLAPRSDSSHRYTHSPVVRDDAVIRGWAAEGYGSRGVAMCGPP